MVFQLLFFIWGTKQRLFSASIIKGKTLTQGEGESITVCYYVVCVYGYHCQLVIQTHMQAGRSPTEPGQWIEEEEIGSEFPHLRILAKHFSLTYADILTYICMYIVFI